MSLPVAYIYLYMFFTRKKTLYNPFSAFLPVEAVVQKKAEKKLLVGRDAEGDQIPTISPGKKMFGQRYRCEGCGGDTGSGPA